MDRDLQDINIENFQSGRDRTGGPIDLGFAVRHIRWRHGARDYYRRGFLDDTFVPAPEIRTLPVPWWEAWEEGRQDRKRYERGELVLSDDPEALAYAEKCSGEPKPWLIDYRNENRRQFLRVRHKSTPVSEN